MPKKNLLHVATLLSLILVVTTVAASASDNQPGLDCDDLIVSVLPEPAGYAESCLGEVYRSQTGSNGQALVPTHTAFALDIGFISDNFVSHQLNDFPGQTVLGSNSQQLFAMDFDPTATTLYALDNSSRELGTLDLANGDFNSIAVVSGIPITDTITGLTIDPASGDAYVSSVTITETAMYLFSMDLSTGQATLIGSDPSVPFMIDIAIGPQGIMYGHDISTDSIYTIDVSSAAATLVGPTGVDSNFAQGLDFDNHDGTLYAYTYQGGGENIYGTIDLASGELTPLASSNPQGEFEGATQTELPETTLIPAVMNDVCHSFNGPDEQEPNDIPLQANGYLCFGRDYSGNASADGVDRMNDYFFFDLPPGRSVTVNVTNFLQVGQVQLFYYTNTMEPVMFLGDQSDGTYQLTYDGPAGKYYVRLVSLQPADQTYTLRVTLP